MKNHTFVILAHKESEYLEECVKSVVSQDQKSSVVIATSTPNAFIKNIARKYDLAVIENKNTEKGIARDFEFALNCVDSRFVTIAHQDDLYDRKYLKEVSKVLRDDTQIAFTDYYELKNAGLEKTNRNIRVKRLLLLPLSFRRLQGSKRVKRACLSLGNPICCPSVTFNRNLIKDPLFISEFKSNMDWLAWEKLSQKKGRFAYVKKPLFIHRVHSKSTTSEIIRANRRTTEDYQAFRKFWPDFVAKLLTKIYQKSEKNNN